MGSLPSLRVATLALLPLVLMNASPASAQADTAARAVQRDTAVIGRVAAGVFALLGPELAAAALDSSRSTAWRLRTPEPAAPAWAAVEAHLLRSVRGRHHAEGDERYRTLAIEPLVLRGDTVFIQVSLGTQWRCGREWRGHGNTYELRITRHGTAWTAPRMTMVESWNSGECELRGV